MVYPIFVVVFAVGILVSSCPDRPRLREKIFTDFKTDLPAMIDPADEDLLLRRQLLVSAARIPLSIWLSLKLIRKFSAGRMGWDMFILKTPIFGQLVEKNIIARSMRTLGTLVASGVPILEALHITKETSGNAVFEVLFQKVYESIREGESIAKPMKENSAPSFIPWPCSSGSSGRRSSACSSTSPA